MVFAGAPALESINNSLVTGSRKRLINEVAVVVVAERVPKTGISSTVARDTGIRLVSRIRVPNGRLGRQPPPTAGTRVVPQEDR